MKDIGLVKLKKLAARLLNPTDRFSEVSDKFEWKAVASPAVISALIEQLEAAQRERDEVKERLALVREQRDDEINRNTALEAELKRRNAQEPVVYMWDSDRKDVDAAGYYRPEHKTFAESSVKRYGGKVVALYAAAPAAVPEKVVTLPFTYYGVMQDGKAVMIPAPDGQWLNKTAVLESLTAAGVKWVERE